MQISKRIFRFAHNIFGIPVVYGVLHLFGTTSKPNDCWGGDEFSSVSVSIKCLTTKTIKIIIRLKNSTDALKCGSAGF